MGGRFGRLFEDMHVVWAALVAATATALCTVLIAVAMYGTAPGRTDSLAAITTGTAARGFNANPVHLNQRIQVPRVQPEAVMSAMLVNQFSAEDEGDEKIFALATVVTREGTTAGLEVLLASGHDEEVQLSLLDVASAARFEPATLHRAG